MQSSGKRRLILAACTWTCVANVAAAQTNAILTFDELPFQSAHGVSVNGVEIKYTIDDDPSTEAFYSSFGPADATDAISDPSLTGDSAGVLSFEFLVPSPLLEFGVALNTADALSPGFWVELFDDVDASYGVTPVATESSDALGFSEGVFSYAGDPIVRAEIRFAPANGDFALDNLKYRVPEPPSIALIVCAAGVSSQMLLLRRRLT